VLKAFNVPSTDLELAQRAFLDTANPLLIMQGLFGITVLLLLLLPIRNLDAGKVLKTKWRKKCFC
jgi:hypothetical protein